MSTIPSRSRSLRKPNETGRYGRPPLAADEETNTEKRNAQSPSRLPVKPPSRTATTRPPSSTSIASNTSMRPPPTRANISKPTTGGGLQRSTSARRTNESAPLPSDPIKQDRSRPPLTQSKHLRNASASSFGTNTRASSHTRTKSTSTVLSTSTALRPPSRDEASKLHESQLKRPAFSTLQQHFSPAKSLAPKPHPAAFLAPPSPSKLPSNIAISAETAKLQNELLGLHLLHRNAPAVDELWRASAKHKLSVRFQELVDKNDELTHRELEEMRTINALALKQWVDNGTPGWGIEEKIQMLDEVVTGAWNLSDSGGKYAKVVRRFERWLKGCQDILNAREADGQEVVGRDGEVIFIEEMDPAWKDDCLSLGRKLEGWSKSLKDLGLPPETKGRGSTLGVILEGFENFVRGMITELNFMAGIERDMVEKELQRIRKMNDAGISDDDNNCKLVAGAIWRNH